MKKIMVMVLALCSLCAICFAKLEQPKDERWVIAGGDEVNQEIWIDIDSINYGKSKEIGHAHHNAANIWFMNIDHKAELKVLLLTEFDFECRTIRQVSFSAYDKEQKFLGTYPGKITGEPVIPGSVGEDIYSVLSDLYELRNDAEAYAMYINGLKAYTEQYKSGKAV